MYLHGIPCRKAVQYANGKHELGRLDGNRKIVNGLTSYLSTTFRPKILLTQRVAEHYFFSSASRRVRTKGA